MPSAVLRYFHRTPKSSPPPLSNAYLVSPLIANLRENWHQLHDIDRALAIREIIQLGVSRRNLGREIGFSESLLRHLLKALDATPSDIELAGQNAISTNELVRRTKPEYVAPTKPSQNGIGIPVPIRVARRPVYDATVGCALILAWLRQDAVRSAWAPEILKEAFHVLKVATERDRLPQDHAPGDLPVEEIIRCCRPDPDHFDWHLAMHAFWLALWVFHLILDPELCCEALNRAIDRVRTSGSNPNLW